MSEAPERIWVKWPSGYDATGLAFTVPGVGVRAEYTHINTSKALVAAAYQDAAGIAENAWHWPESEASPTPTREAIVGRTPADAQAALGRVVQAAVKVERERCASKAMEIAVQMEIHCATGSTTAEKAEEIAAAIRGGSDV